MNNLLLLLRSKHLHFSSIYFLLSYKSFGLLLHLNDEHVRIVAGVSFMFNHHEVRLTLKCLTYFYSHFAQEGGGPLGHPLKCTFPDKIL